MRVRSTEIKKMCCKCLAFDNGEGMWRARSKHLVLAL